MQSLQCRNDLCDAEIACDNCDIAAIAYDNWDIAEIALKKPCLRLSELLKLHWEQEAVWGGLTCTVPGCAGKLCGGWMLWQHFRDLHPKDWMTISKEGYFHGVNGVLCR